MDGSDEEQFAEVREVIDDLYTRRELDASGKPLMEEIIKSTAGGQSIDDDLESGSAEKDLSTEEILRGLPVLFLLNKKDRAEFVGLENIKSQFELDRINCVESHVLPLSALDSKSVEEALTWIYKAVVKHTTF